MFDLSNIQSVRRDDLVSHSASSRSTSPAISDSALPDAQQRLGRLLNLDSLLLPVAQEPQPSISPAQQNTQEEEDEQEFNFRLFRAPVAQPSTSDQPSTTPRSDDPQKQQDGAQKIRIRLRSPTPGAGGADEGGLVNPFRGWQYYFSTPGLLSGEKGLDEDPKILSKRKQFEDIAVSGQDMMSWAKVPWPGCHLPWRVTRLKREHTKLPREPKATETAAMTCILLPEERIPTSRKKPGKKRRIQLRKRAVVAERAKETEAEKRNRKNRERKIKRRQKARDLKAVNTAAGSSEGDQSKGAPTAGDNQNSVNGDSD